MATYYVHDVIVYRVGDAMGIPGWKVSVYEAGTKKLLVELGAFDSHGEAELAAQEYRDKKREYREEDARLLGLRECR